MEECFQCLDPTVQITVIVAGALCFCVLVMGMTGKWDK